MTSNVVCYFASYLRLIIESAGNTEPERETMCHVELTLCLTVQRLAI